MAATAIEIFRPGRHVAMAGEELDFTAADLAAAVAAYDPDVHEAPIVVGHPAHDLPAYGWVKRLAFQDGHLVAELDRVDPEFRELVERGRYKKISASFYRPDAPANPTPGVWHLRHVGFLGAQAPAVKGLKPVSRLGPEMVEMVRRLHADGMSIDQVRQRLGALGVTISRSVLGRHIQRMSAPCPVGVAEELAAMRASIDRLVAAVGELPRELREIRHADIVAFRGSVRELTEELAGLRVILARIR